MSGKPTAERFATTTLDLIAEQGGSLNVNLRQVSRRMGCAHTNVYNYFPSYQSLLWEAFRRGLDIYAAYLIHDLGPELTAREYLHRVIANLASFPEKHPGLYRFIGSDPIDLDEIPPDILDYVTGMKEWLAEAFSAAAPGLSPREARGAADIVLAYIDGETLNLINGREVPSDNLRSRIVRNATKLFELLTDEPNPGTAPPPDARLIYAKRRDKS
jgi:AcrR family transcriptional regulator